MKHILLYSCACSTIHLRFEPGPGILSNIESPTAIPSVLLHSMTGRWLRVVRGKPNHLLVNLISSKVRCVFSTSKVATNGPQRSVLTDNEANRTKVNIQRTTNSRLFRSVWFVLKNMNVLVKRTGDVCKPNRVVGVTPIEHAFEIESSAGFRMSVVIGGDNTRSCTGLRRARRRWHGGTRRPPPAVHQHQADTIQPLCSKAFNAVIDCADQALVLLQIRENQIRCVGPMSLIVSLTYINKPNQMVRFS